MLLLSITHLVAIAFICRIAWREYIRGYSLLAFNVLGFSVFCSFGLCFAPYCFPILDISTNEVPFLCNNDPALYLRQILAHWTFLSIPIITLLARNYWLKLPKVASEKVSRNNVLLQTIKWALLFGGVALSIKYYFFGPGLDILYGTQIRNYSEAEASAGRQAAKEMIDRGQGAFMAQTASYILFPLAAFTSLQNKRKIDWAVFSFSVLGSLVYGIQTRQKSPIVIPLCFYTLMFIVYKIRDDRIENLMRSLKAIFIVLIGGLTIGAVSYYINYGKTVTESITSIVVRTFLVPCYSETNYFVLFPEMMQYRGVLDIYSMELGQWGNDQGVTIQDVAYAVSGTRYSANASIPAIAWSGFGFTGVLLTSLTLTMVLLPLDKMMASADTKLTAWVLILSIPSVSVLVSGGFTDYISNGGIILPGVLLLIPRLVRLFDRR